MYTNTFLKVALSALTFSLVCMPSSARRRPHARPARPVVVVSATPPAYGVSSYGLSTRLSMLVAYLDNHKTISVSKYARMTKLTQAAAKAELNGFARDSRCPVYAIAKKGKTLYALTR